MGRRNNGGAQKRAIRRLQREGEHTTHCTWCGVEIYWLNMIPKQYIVKIAPSHVIVSVNGFRRELPIATVDHYIELRNGGTNDVRNLVPSCAPCNRERSAQSASRSSFCIDCGERNRGASRRRCKKCCEIKKREYFAALADQYEPPIVYAN